MEILSHMLREIREKVNEESVRLLSDQNRCTKGEVGDGILSLFLIQ